MILSVNRWFKSTAVIFSLICGAGQIADTLAKGYPNEHLVTQRWHYLSASRSPSTNPSFINEENYFTAKYAFSKTLSEFTFHELGIVYPLGLYQSVGVQWLLQTANAFNITEGIPGVTTGPDEFRETSNMFYDNKNYFTITYANNLWKRLTLGANVNISMNTIGSEMDMGVGLVFWYWGRWTKTKQDTKLL